MSALSSLSSTVPSQSGGPVHLLIRLYAFVVERIERAHATAHLTGLDDRLLADMGIARDELATLFR
jgi:hypothetical protein